MPDTMLRVGGYELKISEDRERWYFRPVKVGWHVEVAWRLPMVSPWETVNAVVLRLLLELEHAREAASDRLPCGHPVACLPVEQGRESSAPVEAHGCDWCWELKKKDAEAACWRVMRDTLTELSPGWLAARDLGQAAMWILRGWYRQAAEWRLVRDTLNDLDPEWSTRALDPDQSAVSMIRKWHLQARTNAEDATAWHAMRDLLSEMDPDWTRRAENPGEAAGLTLRAWVQQAAQSNEDRREAQSDHARLVALEDRVYRMLVETPDAVAVGSVRARVEELEKACRVLESDCALVAFVEGVRDALVARVEKLEREDVVEHNLVASQVGVLKDRQTRLLADVNQLLRFMWRSEHA